MNRNSLTAQVKILEHLVINNPYDQHLAKMFPPARLMAGLRERSSRTERLELREMQAPTGRSPPLPGRAARSAPYKARGSPPFN